MDNHSTTRLDPRVLDAMLPFLRERFGNAASHGHELGCDARRAVERAREIVAGAIGASAAEVVFTSGATESDSLAVIGTAEGAGIGGDHVVTAPTEHRAVLDPVRSLEERGFRVTRVAVDRFGRVDPDDVARAITDRTVLVSLMAANNEVGTLHPVREIGARVRARGVVFHTDAAQSLGRVDLDVVDARVDLASLSAHKIHGPKGVGALFVRRDPSVRLRPLMVGGGHERGLRAGTPNVPGIVGFGAAVELAMERRHEERREMAGLRDRLLRKLNAEIPGVRLNGHPEERLPNNLNVSFAGVDGEALLALVDDVALSTGSACMSASGEPSHVLRSMGLPADRLQGSVRFGLSRFNTAAEVDYVAARLAEAVSHLRRLAPETGIR